MEQSITKPPRKAAQGWPRDQGGRPSGSCGRTARSLRVGDAPVEIPTWSLLWRSTSSVSENWINTPNPCEMMIRVTWKLDSFTAWPSSKPTSSVWSRSVLFLWVFFKWGINISAVSFKPINALTLSLAVLLRLQFYGQDLHKWTTRDQYWQNKGFTPADTHLDCRLNNDSFMHPSPH